MNGIEPPSPNARDGLPKLGCRRLVERGLQPRRERRRVPTRRRSDRRTNCTCAPYGGSVGEASLDRGRRSAVIARRWQAQAELQRGVRAQARCRPAATGGMPSTPVTLSVGCQVRASSCSAGSSTIGSRAVDEREVPADRELGGGRRWPARGDRRDLDVQLRQQQPAVDAVLDAVEQLAADAERRRHDAAGLAAVHALGQDVDAQRRRRPGRAAMW